MSLSKLADTLRAQAASSGKITLNNATLQESGADNISSIIQDIRDYLGLLSSAGQYLEVTELKGLDIENPKDNKLTLSTGGTSFLNAKMPVKVLQFTLIDNKLQIFLHGGKLTDMDGSNWYFYTSFPSLFVFPHLNNHLQEPCFIFSTNPAPTSWIINQEALMLNHGLNFHVNLDYATAPIGAAKEFLKYIGAGALEGTFYLFGVIDIKNSKEGILTFPNIDLKSPICNNTGSWKFFDIFEIHKPCFGIRLVDIPEEGDNPHDVTTEFYFQVEIIIKDFALEFSTSITQDSNFLMFGVTSLDKKLTAEHIIELMNGNEWPNDVPNELKQALNTIEFQGFSALMFFGEVNGKTVFNLNSITVSIGSELISFDPFGEFVFSLNWTILNPTNPDKESRDTLLSSDAVVDFDNIGGTFDVEITW